MVRYPERFSPERLDGFSFASRKLPEQMHWRLIDCSSCELLFASPAPDSGTVAASYREAAYDSGDEARYAAHTYGRLLRSMLPGAGGRALDVGAGDGAFLRVLEDLGFEEVEGVEPSRAAREAAPPALRPLIREEVFDSDRYDRGRFDLVSALHVADHMPYPLEALTGVRRLLCEGGRLLVVCHDESAAINRLMGTRSPIYDVEHLQLFSPRTLAALLERAGYHDVSVRRFANRYPLRYWLRLTPIGRRPKQRLILALDRLGLGRLPLTLPVGNLVACARR